MIDKPKKERRFLKALGRVGEILIQEVLIKIGSNLIKKIGGKKTLPSILFLLASLSLFAQYPATGNKQRLGYQTTGDGLVFRGRASDTTTIKSSGLNNAYFILDTVNNVLFNYIKTKGGWVFNNTDTVINNITVDTTSLSNRINLKLNISDTASMLTPYFKDADTTNLNLTSRFAAKLNISDTASMLTNYLRTATAASTYLPLTGGTLIGSLDINTNDGGNNFQDSTLKITYNQSSLGVNQNVTGIYSSVNTTGYTSTGILSEASTIYSTAIGVKGKATQSDINGPGVAYGIVGEIAASGSGSNGSTYAGYFNNTSTVGGNNYGLFVNTASGGDYGIYQTGTGVNYLGSNSIFGGNIGIGNNNPTVALDILKSTSSTSAKIRLSTDFQSAVRTLELSSGDGLSWDLPGSTSQSPFIKVVGGDQTFGGGGLNLITNDISRLFIRQNGTVGIGTITPSATFEVHGSAVFNEGSTDSDFRVESDGNVNMVFVDASTDRVGIGTNAPSKTLEVSGTFNATGDITEGGNNVLTNLDTASLSSRIDLKLNKTDTASLSNRINGKVSLTGDEYINGQKTFGGLIIPSNGMQLTATGNNSNKLIGINASSFVGEVTLGTGLTLTSNVLNATERYYFDLGIIAGAADNSASTYDFTYGSNIFIVPTSLNGYCIDSVYIRAIGCSTCPPVSPDLDYYVGVYKANAGARVATSGATLVGSQITMNEYDLNEVNRNDTLLTGEAWWVYLNGTYTSDLAYVTAGFIVKKTCN